MYEPAGTPSDQTPGVLATGRPPYDFLYVSMSAGDDQGRDADYLEWHTYDHRPEQHRLEGIGASVRLMATPELVSARLSGAGSYASIRHVMMYLMTGQAAHEPFKALGGALAASDRSPFYLPSIERTGIRRTNTLAAERIKVGADVLPWWPAQSAFLLLEEGAMEIGSLVDTPGVAGAWTGTTDTEGSPVPQLFSEPAVPAAGPRRLTWLILDRDPLEVTAELKPVLEARWGTGTTPLLAAPFWTIHRREDWLRQQ